VRLLERTFPGIVTGKAQRDRRLDQQVFFVGSVGEVARLASACGYDFVDGFLLVALLFVALVAKFGTFRLQEVACLGGVRVMARGAFPPRQYGVNVGLVHPDFLLGVAGVADLVAVFLEDQPRNDPVANVALLAFLSWSRHAHISSENIDRRIFMAVETLFFVKVCSRPSAQARKGPNRRNADAKRKAFSFADTVFMSAPARRYRG
jgi:hypothetical protein